MQARRALVLAALLCGLARGADARPPARGDEIRARPRLQLAVSPVLGPYSRGETDCRPRGGYYYCEDGGTFLGAGATVELRLRAVGPLYFHTRGLLVGNVRRPPEAVYAGLGGVGVGVGLYARLAFVRAEYLVVDAFGSERYKPPFGDLRAASDVYGHHAGMLSGGVRFPFRERFDAELWGGFVVGPYARRETPFEVSYGERVMVSFLLGVGLSFDLIRGERPPAR